MITPEADLRALVRWAIGVQRRLEGDLARTTDRAAGNHFPHEGHPLMRQEKVPAVEEVPDQVGDAPPKGAHIRSGHGRRSGPPFRL